MHMELCVSAYTCMYCHLKQVTVHICGNDHSAFMLQLVKDSMPFGNSFQINYKWNYML